MKSQILLVILAASIFQVAFSAACGATAAGCSGGTPSCDRIGTHTGGTCIATSANCQTGYNVATGTTAAAAASADCANCWSTYALNAKTAAATKCVAKTIAAGDGCLAGYTDKSDGTAANTVTLVGDCSYCAPGYTANATSGKCEATASSSMITYGVMLLAVLFAGSHMPSDIVSFVVPGLKLNFAHSSRCRATSLPREERQLLIVA